MADIKKKISEALDMPSSSLGSVPYIEIEGNGMIKLDCCIEILSYDEERCELRLKGLVAEIVGRDLTVSSYGGGTVRLCGMIKGVSLTPYGRKRC